MRILAVVAGAMMAAAGLAARPEITLGTIAQGRNRAVTVNYTLDRPAIVTVEIILDGNRLPLGDQRLEGDVNRYVKTAGAHAFQWVKPQQSLPEGDYKAVYRLTAWATNQPPKYLVYDIVNHKTRYYAAEDAIPGGLTGIAAQHSLFVMRKVEAAGVEFLMGSQPGENGRDAVREASRMVTLTEDYYLAIFEATHSQMTALGLPEQTYWTGTNIGEEVRGSLPYGISYNYLRGEQPAIDWPTTGHRVAPGSALQLLRDVSGVEFDLPTEAQWEYACRAGRSGMFYNERTSPDAIAWYSANSQNRVHAVGLKAPNAWGFYDMLGNMNEWCLDWVSTTRPFSEADVVDPKGFTSGDGRPTRGGAYGYGSGVIRTARRGKDPANAGGYNMGVRLACPAAAFVEP